MKFDLTTESWIPAIDDSGDVLLLSTRDVLARAHELRAVALESPLEEVAVMRFLLAVVHRSVDGPVDLDAWCSLQRAGRFQTAEVNAYLDRVQDRMDIFHSTTPFAQVRGLSEEFSVDPIDMMTVDRRSWGTARELFQHRPPDHVSTMTPAEAARALLAYHAYDVGGLVKKPGEPTSASGAPLIGAAVVLLKGPTLFDTLMRNLLVYDRETKPVSATTSDCPAWERDPLPRSLALAKEPKRTPEGWLDQLTFWSRRIELIEREGSVFGFVRCVGEGLHDATPHDPMVAYRKHDKRGWLPVSIRVDRAFWRDSHALFQTRAVDRCRRPRALDQLATLVVQKPGAISEDASYRIDVIGLATSKSRIDLLRTASIRTLAGPLADPDTGETLQESLDWAERAVSALGKAMWSYASNALSTGDRKPDTKDVRSLVDALGAKADAWASLEPSFHELVDSLAGDLDAAQLVFERAAERAVRQVAMRAMSGGAQSPRWLKARACAEKTLHFELRALRTPTEEVA